MQGFNAILWHDGFVHGDMQTMQRPGAIPDSLLGWGVGDIP